MKAPTHNTNHNKFKFIRTANNESRHSHRSICHSYTLRTKRGKRVRKKRARQRGQTTEAMSHVFTDKARHAEVCEEGRMTRARERGKASRRMTRETERV